MAVSFFFWQFSQYGPVTQVCETGTVFQQKVHESGTFSVNVVFKRLRGWTWGRSIPYKTLYSNPRAICLVAFLM